MVRAPFILSLLLAICFSLATCLQPAQEARDSTEGQSANVMAVLLGDGRRLFANQFFAKADMYFHRGKYPSIFDQQARTEENHMQSASGHENSDGHPDGQGEGHEGHEEHHEDEPVEPPPLDWIERFGRNFYPHKHSELAGSDTREILPWLRLSAEMDPHETEVYTVTSYWLRTHLGKFDEAEDFLRKGLQQNPNATDLLDELARLNFENRHDLKRAKNIWQAALRQWHKVEGQEAKPNVFLLEQILVGLEKIAVEEGRLDEAIKYLKQIKEVSPNPEMVQKQIDEMTAKLHPAPSQ
jgi:tetratricopeptide (TPR) repeat protein